MKEQTGKFRMMRKHMAKSGWFFLLMLSMQSLVLIGQDREFKSWTSVEYRWRMGKRWRVDLGQHIRFKQDFGALDHFITQSHISYTPWKRWRLSAQIRYYRQNDNQGARQGYDNLFRYRIGIEKRFKVKALHFGLRLAYQDRRSLDRSRFASSQDWSVYGKRTKKVLRLRPSVEWKIKDWAYDPVFYVEYLPEYNPNQKPLSFYSIRYGLGTEKKISKSQSISIRYFFERSKFRKSDYAYATHVLQLRYMFKGRKKKN